ncbi:MAG: hypothetical protein AAFN09_03980 [Pseudomonadota bacterium]
MHILIGLAALIGGALMWVWRIKMAKEAASELSDMASDVMAAARRLGFRRRRQGHPVESIDDAQLAAGALSVALVELGPRLTQEAHIAHLRSLQSHLSMDLTTAEETQTLGHWLVSTCDGPVNAIARIGRQLYTLAGAQSLDAPLKVVGDVAGQMGGLNDAQREALEDLQRIFKRS